MCSVVMAGTGSAKSWTMSQAPASMNPSMHWSTKPWIAGSSFFTAAGESSGFMILLYCWKSGGSDSMGSARRWTSLGGMTMLFSEENVRSSRATLLMSSYFESTQNPP